MADARSFETAGGVRVHRSHTQVAYDTSAHEWVKRLDTQRGAFFSSNYEYPGRYTRWDIGFVNPPLVLTSRDRDVTLEALNERGILLLAALQPVLKSLDALEFCKFDSRSAEMRVVAPTERFDEEERSRQPSVFSIIRAINEHFACDDETLGLYGAFGYDLAFQFEPIKLALERPSDQRDIVLYLPDEHLVLDHHGRRAQVIRFEFEFDGQSTEGLARDGSVEHFHVANEDPGRGDHVEGEYAASVGKAKEFFARGDLFEVVPGQTFYQACSASPSSISAYLKATNPSPYSFFINLGSAEYLVGASPEMFVRVTGGRRVETCPISGTIKRGNNAIEDEAQIRKLLNSAKDEAELTMCSDVDRNDKARVSIPGSVRVIGRRQIEIYSRLIHTVDHIEGILRDGMDALDAFLSHTWAVTVTGAPKRWAMQFIENNEKSPRAWYGGAVGWIGFNGDLNTGLTLRTVRIKDGIAQIRAGATLLYDSDPHEEEKETELKASAMIAAVRDAGLANQVIDEKTAQKPGTGKRILFIDHEDSFVHMLADYFRQTGAHVRTVRAPISEEEMKEYGPDLLVMSPGPGRPGDFDCARSIRLARNNAIPIFGVCLGLQALTESFGGELDQLATPVHGKASEVKISDTIGLFHGFDGPITVGRYHSLHAANAKLPDTLKVTAETADGIIMAVEHGSEPIAAVQFHPESIMSLADDTGHRIIANALKLLT